MRGVGSDSSLCMYVNGRSFIDVSISHKMVCSSSYVIIARPSTFFNVVFIIPINRSQKPPNHGARLGINFHCIPFFDRLDFTVELWYILWISEAVDK